MAGASKRFDVEQNSVHKDSKQDQVTIVVTQLMYVKSVSRYEKVGEVWTAVGCGNCGIG